MSDPFSIATGIVDIASLALELGKQLHDYYADVNSASRNVAALRCEVEAVTKSLLQLQSFLKKDLSLNKESHHIKTNKENRSQVNRTIFHLGHLGHLGQRLSTRITRRIRGNTFGILFFLTKRSARLSVRTDSRTARVRSQEWNRRKRSETDSSIEMDR